MLASHSTMRTSVVSLLVAATLCCFSIAQPSSGPSPAKTVNVVVRAKWNASSIVTNAAEFFRDTNADAYWNFISAVLEATVSGSLTSDQKQYDFALTQARHLLGASSVAVLTYSLSIHYYAPKIETYRQLLSNHLAEVYGSDTARRERLSRCDTLIFVAGQFLCDFSFDLTTLAQDSTRVASSTFGNSSSHAALLDFDHVYPGFASDAPPVILYADLETAATSGAHRWLISQSEAGRLKYVLRPRPRVSSTPLLVQGFGVELAIKNMEYKVIDDSKLQHDSTDTDLFPGAEGEMEENDVMGFYFSRLSQRKPAVAEDLHKFQQALLAETSKEEKVNVWDMQNIGTQAVQRILHSADPFSLLQLVAQNFPMYANALVRIKPNQTVAAAIKNNQRFLGAGSSLLTLNGISMDPESVDLFELHNLLRAECGTMDLLAPLGLSPAAIKALLSLSVSHTQALTEYRLDMETGKTNLISWVNNLEDKKEKRYVQWSHTVSQLLAPGWPNQLRYIRKNLYTAVVVADGASLTGLAAFAKAVFFVNANAPVRTGFVLYAERPQGDHAPRAAWDGDLVPKSVAGNLLDSGSGSDDDPEQGRWSHPSALVAKAVYHLDKVFSGEKKSAEFIVKLHDVVSSKRGGASATADDIRSALRSFITKASDLESAWEKITKSRAYDKWLLRAQEFLSFKGFQDSGPHMVLNGRVHSVSADTYREVMMNEVLTQQHAFQFATYRGEVTDDTNFDDYHSTRVDAVPRLSRFVLQAAKDQKYVSSLPSDPTLLRYALPVDSELTAPRAVTQWVVIDPSTTAGIRVLAAALSHVMQQNPSQPDSASKDASSPTGTQELQTRLAVLLNPRSKDADSLDFVTRFFGALHQHFTAPPELFSAYQKTAMVLQYATSHFETNVADVVQMVLVRLAEHLGVPATLYAEENTKVAAIIRAQQQYVRSATAMAPGVNGVISNGRVLLLTLDDVDQAELQHDLVLLAHAHAKFAKLAHVLKAVTKDNAAQGPFISEAVLRAHWALALRAKLHKAADSQVPEDVLVRELGSISYSSKSGQPHHVVAVLDPLSQAAQRVMPVLVLLRDLFDWNIVVYFNPRKDMPELPLKRFYRFALPPTHSLTFDESSGAARASSPATFRNIVSKNVLTLTMDTPEPWIVMSEIALHDLDNLRLGEVTGAAVNVQYALEHLLVAGSCKDVTNEDHPAGLQLVLGTPEQAHTQDTLVMANLGYFQLKASPGVWTLRLAANRASQLFQIITKDISGDKTRDTTRLVAVTSFHDSHVKLDVRRKPGQEQAVLLDENSAASDDGIWSKMKGLVSSHDGTAVGEDNTIHIFSVASGHLYERFLKIMMLSTIKNTKSKVKFWFIKNFLSPQFKEFVPHMASKYGFEVELVTYKWPSWLRRQTEKQRVIWGYKILFLDVLFPLKLKRVIFTDADQIVRGDMKELHDMDLRGAPYGYTPFCSTNHATDGMRFWKGGYWEQHLRGKPYHISALYVIDLEKFRRMRAGDTLRMMYDNLSADPNSLANLDQDLPNYAQHQVPIFSLPQEWLWCETWCSMDGLAQAKTIDLCNNPLTKKPKLDVARELFPEWVEYDNEAKALDLEFQANMRAPTSAESASTDTASVPTHNHAAHAVSDAQLAAIRAAQGLVI